MIIRMRDTFGFTIEQIPSVGFSTNGRVTDRASGRSVDSLIMDEEDEHLFNFDPGRERKKGRPFSNMCAVS